MYSERALALADELGLPVPARALGFHGAALSNEGDRIGPDKMEEARRLLVEAGLGRDAAVAQHNLGVFRWELEGPTAALETFEDVREFTAQRGLIEIGASSSATRLGRLHDAGRSADVLADDPALVDLADAGSMNEPAVVELHTAAAGAPWRARRA